MAKSGCLLMKLGGLNLKIFATYSYQSTGRECRRRDPCLSKRQPLLVTSSVRTWRREAIPMPSSHKDIGLHCSPGLFCLHDLVGAADPILCAASEVISVSPEGARARAVLSADSSAFFLAINFGFLLGRLEANRCCFQGVPWHAGHETGPAVRGHLWRLFINPLTAIPDAPSVCDHIFLIPYDSGGSAFGNLHLLASPRPTC
ncbi:hypothetical protein F5Y18DRAFT_168000 [Xylariaceae sp. FL1019]|nr:hypothetical protein F5Y18DRAFT_168000 [Xylariaceae sp. FL1019]